jgi:hypothetical protein
VTGATGAEGKAASNGESGSDGIAGTDGSNGETGATGATGATGETGATGATGEGGAQGATGAAGPTGPEGVKGETGPEGKEGKGGPAGPAGADSPLVFGPYTSTNDPDSGECSSEWAKDTYTRTYLVTPNSDGSFDVTVLVGGTFVTIPGAKQPGATPCGPTVESEVSGKFYGDYVVAIPAGAEFDPEATYNSTDPSLTKSTEEFVEAIFPGQKLGNYAWQFHYRTGSAGPGESWNNTDHGNTGNITG